MDLDSETVWTLGIAGVAAVAIFAGGVFYGNYSVLDGERLKAQNETLYRLVTVQNVAPPSELMSAANEVCAGEERGSKDTCMKDFLQNYGDVYVVNLIDGTRELLRPTPVLPE